MDECPCGRSFPYTDCCGPLIRGASHADTAEDLMRSRFTAYCLEEWEYLIRTQHADERPSLSTEEFERRNRDIEWKKLEILDTEQGEFEDAEGEVTFAACYVEKGEEKTLHETSQFEKRDGRWVYRQKGSARQIMRRKPDPAKPVVRAEKKVGRNHPCPCGSGKKYKKCCGK